MKFTRPQSAAEERLNVLRERAVPRSGVTRNLEVYPLAVTDENLIQEIADSFTRYLTG